MRMQVLQVLDKVGIDYIENPEKLKSLLCPLIAKTAEQQDVFYEQFDRYIEQIKVPLPELPPQPKWYEQIPRWVFALLTLVLFSVLAYFIYQEIYKKEPHISFGIIENKKGSKEHKYVIGDTLLCENLSICPIPYAPEFKWEIFNQVNNLDTVVITNQEDLNLPIFASKGGKYKKVRLTLLNAERKDTIYRSPLVDIEITCIDIPMVQQLGKWKSNTQLNNIDTFRLSNLDTAYQYEWKHEGEIISKDSLLIKTFDEKGPYDFTVVITRPNVEGYCSQSISHKITVNDETPIAYLEPKKLDKEPPMVIGKYNDWYWGLLGLLSLIPLFFWYRWWNSKTTSETEAATKSFQSRFDAPDRAPYFIPFRPFEHVIHAGQSFYRLGNLLRARQEGVGTKLNISKTIQATIEKGGFPEFRLDKNTQPTEYLFLIDQQHRDSIQAHLFDHLVTFLVSKDIYAERYFYNTGFFSFWKKNESEALGLEQLNRLYPYHRLVIMGDAHELLSDEISNGVRLKKDYQYYLNRWQGRILLTPNPSSSWAVEEAGMHQVFEVFPADLQGLMDAFGELNKGREEEEDTTTFKQWRNRQQAIRKDKDIRYQKWRSPQDLKIYLADHPTLWKWLCALAVHPSINWNLTLAIGNALAPQGVEINHDQLLILSRIPWLQKGHFSSALRLKLLKELDIETEQLARQAVKEELEAVENLTRNSFVNFELQADLAIQNFLLEPDNQDYQDIIRQYLTKNDGNSALGKNRIKELDQQINKFQLAKGEKAEGIEVFLKKQSEEYSKNKVSLFSSTKFIQILLFILIILGLWISSFFTNNHQIIRSGYMSSFLIDEREVASSKAAELNNAAVDTSLTSAIDRYVQALSLLDSALVLNKNYGLGQENRAKSLYNLAITDYLKYHEREKAEPELLGTAKKYFSRLIQYDSTMIVNQDSLEKRARKESTTFGKPLSETIQRNMKDRKKFYSSLNIEAFHGIGLCYFYQFKINADSIFLDSAQFYLDTIITQDPTYFTDTLKSKPPHLASLLNFTNQDAQPIQFSFIIQGLDESEGTLENVLGRGIKIRETSNAQGEISFELLPTDEDFGKWITFSKEGYATLRTRLVDGIPKPDTILLPTVPSPPAVDINEKERAQKIIDSLLQDFIAKRDFLFDEKTKDLKLTGELDEVDNFINDRSVDLEKYKQAIVRTNDRTTNDQLIKDFENEIKKTLESIQQLSTPSSIVDPPIANTLTDSRDGKTYKTITIGTQTWMAENLNYTTPDSWCYLELPELCNKAGRLYTWEAAKTACPQGWHLPSDEEWKTLVDNYGGEGTSSYQALIEGGSTNFTALLGGERNSNGEFDSLGEDGFYWSATEYDAANAWYYYFYKESGGVYRDYDDKTYAFSCRCVKD